MSLGKRRCVGERCVRGGGFGGFGGGGGPPNRITHWRQRERASRAPQRTMCWAGRSVRGRPWAHHHARILRIFAPAMRRLESRTVDRRQRRTGRGPLRQTHRKWVRPAKRMTALPLTNNKHYGSRARTRLFHRYYTRTRHHRPTHIPIGLQTRGCQLLPSSYSQIRHRNDKYNILGYNEL